MGTAYVRDRPAVFLDRDGTLVRPRHYPSHPDDLVLADRVAEPLRALQASGYRLIVVTNQSGIARGFFTERDLDAMHAHLRSMLGAFGVTLDDIYYCPHCPDGDVPRFSGTCTCRKPMPGMLLQAAFEHGIDLGTSWLVGDILDDIEAGTRVGCRTVLIDLGTERPPGTSLRRPTVVARDAEHALRIVLADGNEPTRFGGRYLPSGWSPEDLRTLKSAEVAQ